MWCNCFVRTRRWRRIVITNIILSVYTVLLTAAIVYIIVLLRKRKDNIKVIAQLLLNIDTYKNHIAKLTENEDNKNIEQTDGFLKFISQSRDWAFVYIEDAQAKIAKFNQDLDAIIELGGNKKETVKKILEAYEPIRSLLPDEQGEK